MKRLIFYLFIFFAVNGICNAQAGVAPLATGETQLNMGCGFNTEGVPFYVGMDYAILSDVTVGAQVNVVLDDADPSLSIMARGDYHFNYLLNIPKVWDVYAGANAGINFGEGDPLQLGIQLGGRWYWNNKLGINFEIGGGNIFGTTLGVSMKL